MRTLAIYIDWPERLSFFSRLRAGLAESGWQSVFYTNKLALHIEARRAGIPSLRLTRAETDEAVDLERTRERAGNSITRGQAQRLYAAARRSMREISERWGLDGFVTWNGSGVVGRAVVDHADAIGLPTLFLEIANLPGKLFADPKGVNARSALAADPSLLEAYPADLGAFRDWRAAYLHGKSRSHVVPQARALERVRYSRTLLNRLGFLVLGIPRDERTPLARKMWMKWGRKRRKGFEPADLEGAGFVFYPMQVSDDSQLLLNSEIDNEEAIRIAAREAAGRGLRLAVKPHPAEPDPQFIERIGRLSRDLGFSFVGGNTFDLLGRAELVVTVNSTVGLEALLLGKTVRFLGKSFYPHLTSEESMARYILGYLLDIDFFDTAEVPVQQVELLLDRLQGRP